MTRFVPHEYVPDSFEEGAWGEPPPYRTVRQTVSGAAAAVAALKKLKRARKLSQQQHTMDSPTAAPIGWAYLPREILMMIGPLLYDCSRDIPLTLATGIHHNKKITLHIARLTCKHWAYSLPQGICRIHKYDLEGAGPRDWGTRFLSGLEELKWSAPRSLRCAPWCSLRRLVLKNARSTNVALRVLFSCCPPVLAHLDISGSNVADKGLAGAWPPSLRSLDLSNCSKITDAALRSLTHLTSLKLNNCPGINGSGLGELSSVRELTVSGLQITNWDSIKHLPSLEELEAHKVAGLMSLAASLALVSSLTSLHLGEHSSQDSSTNLVLHELRDLPSLSSMVVYSCEGVTDDGIAHLRSLEALTVIECINVRAEGLAPLTRLSRLMLLINSGVGDAGLVELARMPSLTSLHLGCCDAVTEAGIQALRAARPDMVLTL